MPLKFKEQTILPKSIHIQCYWGNDKWILIFIIYVMKNHLLLLGTSMISCLFYKLICCDIDKALYFYSLLMHSINAIPLWWPFSSRGMCTLIIRTPLFLKHLMNILSSTVGCSPLTISYNLSLFRKAFSYYSLVQSIPSYSFRLLSMA